MQTTDMTATQAREEQDRKAATIRAFFRAERSRYEDAGLHYNAAKMHIILDMLDKETAARFYDVLADFVAQGSRA